MKHSFFFLIAILLLGGCKSDAQKQREKQLEEYETLYQTERAKMDPKVFEHRLDTSKYEILEIKPVGSGRTNYYVLIKNYPLSEDSIRKFVQDFMHDHCVRQSNLCVVDDKRAYPLITEMSKNDSLQIFTGDHVIATAANYTSDLFSPVTDEILMYPYQQIAYKKAGGKNNKRKSIGNVGVK